MVVAEVREALEGVRCERLRVVRAAVAPPHRRVRRRELQHAGKQRRQAGRTGAGAARGGRRGGHGGRERRHGRVGEAAAGGGGLRRGGRDAAAGAGGEGGHRLRGGALVGRVIDVRCGIFVRIHVSFRAAAQHVRKEQHDL